MWREELKRKSSSGVPSRVQFQPLFATSMNFESLKPARPGPLGCLVGYSLKWLFQPIKRVAPHCVLHRPREIANLVCGRRRYCEGRPPDKGEVVVQVRPGPPFVTYVSGRSSSRSPAVVPKTSTHNPAHISLHHLRTYSFKLQPISSGNYGNFGDLKETM